MAMNQIRLSQPINVILLTLGIAVAGCGDAEVDSIPDSARPGGEVELGDAGSFDEIPMFDEEPTTEDTTTEDPNADESEAPPKRSFAPVTLGGGANNSPASADKAAHDHKHAENADSVVAAMQPLQVVLGTWRGITQKATGGFKAVDELNWVWDFQTDANQPALVATSDASPYIANGRLTYVADKEVYRFSCEDKDGKKRVYEGTFIEPPQDVPGDDKKLQRTYKLELTESAPESPKDVWRIVFNQQENNRYLMELYRQRGGDKFFRFDTVSTQREGTSFALSDTDYKEKTCIISQGLGTIQVSHKGKSYWVCCSGCKAAFEEDPEKWLAKLAQRDESAK